MPKVGCSVGAFGDLIQLTDPVGQFAVSPLDVSARWQARKCRHRTTKTYGWLPREQGQRMGAWTKTSEASTPYWRKAA